MRTRILIGGAGVLLGLFGVFRLVTQIPAADLMMLFVWLLGALVVHDGILAPVTVGVGAAIARFVPPRARRFLQGGVVVGVLITVVAIPLIYRRGSQPAVKAILQRDYSTNLAVLLGIVAGGALLLYLLRVARERQRASTANVRPSEDQRSTTE